MITRLIHCTVFLISTLYLSASFAQAQTDGSNSKQNNNGVTNSGGFSFFELFAQARTARRPSISLMPSGRNASMSAPRFTFTTLEVGANQLIIAAHNTN
jgi:hypothetical protein